MANPFVHVELQTSDLTQAKAFYTRLFDWKLEDLPASDDDMAYTIIHVGEGTGGGMFTNPRPGTPSHWLPYVAVDDIEATTARARELGAEIVQDAMEIGEYGWISVIRDPTGALIGMWKPKEGM